MFAKEEGVPVDPVALGARIASAVVEVVGKQVAAGIDIVNDGELSKPSYATYIKDRLAGFGGESHPLTYQDLVDFPEMARRVFGDPGRARRKTPGCNGPIAVHDAAAAETDAANLKAALSGVVAQEGFLSAASPGLVSLFFHNGHYSSHEAYLEAIAEAMRQEYEAVVDAGFILQLDCPDLAMLRHTVYLDKSLGDFRNIIAVNVAALNHAVADIPADRMRMHVCWGSTVAPHHTDVPLIDIIDIVLTAKPLAVSFPAANGRHEHEWKIWREIELPAGKVIVPGVIDSTVNTVEHPELVADRILNFANAVGRENVIAGVDCGFGTFAGRVQVDTKIVWLKLQSLAEGARRASAQLWARAA
jgi:5-methyltetrahydropteroyltriglutamate--homocysteine methyltransferase